MMRKLWNLFGDVIGTDSSSTEIDNDLFRGNSVNQPVHDDERWNKLLDQIVVSLDEGNYNKADSQLKNYYSQYENGEKDYWFFYCRAAILLRKLEETGAESGGLRPSLIDAWQMAPDDECRQDIKRLEDRFKETISNSDTEYEDSCEWIDEDPQKISLKERINRLAREASLEVIDDCENLYQAYLDALAYLSDDEKYFSSNAFYANVREYCSYGWNNNWEIEGWDKDDDVSEIDILILSASGILSHKILKNDSYPSAQYCSIDEWMIEWSEIRLFVPSGIKCDELRFEIDTDSYQENHRFYIDANKWKPILDKVVDMVSEQSEFDSEITDEEICVDDDLQDVKDSENLYKEEVLIILQDGEIGVPERIILERKRKRLGLTEEQAKKIEDSCSSPSLSERELEYLELYKDIVKNSEPIGRIRKMLDREADALGLTSDQKTKVESMMK